MESSFIRAVTHSPFRKWMRLVQWTAALAIANTLLAAKPVTVDLPALDRWDAQSIAVAESGGITNVTVPRNYDIGRVVSPEYPVAVGDILTFAVDLHPRFAGKEPSFYRCWLELEFLDGKKVVAAVPSPELVGTHEQAQLLAVTADAPQGATAVRVAVCAQNKYWNPVENSAVLSNLRLFQQGGRPQGRLHLETSGELPKKQGARTVKLVLRGDMPDETAVSVKTTRGKAPPSVLMKSNRAEFTLQYSDNDVGGGEVIATARGENVSVRVTDPMAATLEIGRIEADGLETPALLQLVKDGKMIPGRYQMSTPGIFATAPWSVDLAPGRWQVKIRRGPEFQVLERMLEVESGEKVRWDNLVLIRNVDPRKAGWYGGDADGDVYHGERVYTDVSAGTAAEISQAMGLDWAGVGNWGSPAPQTWGEAKACMRQLSRPNFLFMWTDEKPKTGLGHACFVGVERPDADRFGWNWTGAKRALRNFEMLQMVRSSGGATFANHPLRWWMSGDKFRSNMYSTLPFDLCVAGLLDGYNVTEKPLDLMVWSMLLDHGYRVAATTGADFGLDRPGGPVPGKIRMYGYCPEGLSASALAQAVRRGHTIVSTGPILLADVDGQPPGTTLQAGGTYQIAMKAWARADEEDQLQRAELWSHGKAVATRVFENGVGHAGHVFPWKPEGEWDWAAIRLVTKRGWALTSAFYAAGPTWRAPEPVQCRLTVSATGLSADELKETLIEVWDVAPDLAPARMLSQQPFRSGETLLVPVGGSVVVVAPKARRKTISVYDAVGMPKFVEHIASGVQRERPLLDWKTYEEALSQCREAKVELTF